MYTIVLISLIIIFSKSYADRIREREKSIEQTDKKIQELTKTMIRIEQQIEENQRFIDKLDVLEAEEAMNKNNKK